MAAIETHDTSLLTPPTSPKSKPANSGVVTHTFVWPHHAGHASLAGSFDGPEPQWQPLPMHHRKGVEGFELALPLTPGKVYTYKFVIDGQWVTDWTRETVHDNSGNVNHQILAEAADHDVVEEEKIDDFVEERPTEIAEDEVVIENFTEEKPAEIVEEEAVIEDFTEEKPAEIVEEEAVIEDFTEEKPAEIAEEEAVIEDFTEERPAQIVEEEAVIEDFTEEKPAQIVEEEDVSKERPDEIAEEAAIEDFTEEWPDENAEEEAVVEDFAEEKPAEINEEEEAFIQDVSEETPAETIQWTIEEKPTEISWGIEESTQKPEWNTSEFVTGETEWSTGEAFEDNSDELPALVTEEELDDADEDEEEPFDDIEEKYIETFDEHSVLEPTITPSDEFELLKHEHEVEVEDVASHQLDAIEEQPEDDNGAFPTEVKLAKVEITETLPETSEIKTTEILPEVFEIKTTEVLPEVFELKTNETLFEAVDQKEVPGIRTKVVSQVIKTEEVDEDLEEAPVKETETIGTEGKAIFANESVAPELVISESVVPKLAAPEPVTKKVKSVKVKATAVRAPTKTVTDVTLWDAVFGLTEIVWIGILASIATILHELGIFKKY